MSRQDLVDMNDARKSRPNETIRELLDGQHVAESGFVFTGLARDVALAYAVRNTGGHSVASFPVMRERKAELRQSVFNTLFLVVELFYV